MKRSLPTVLSLLVLVSSVAAAPVPPPEKLLGKETLFVMTVPDYAKSSGIWSKWPSALMWNDDAMKPFRDKLTKKFQSAIVEPMEKEFGIKFSDYTALAQGQVTFALTMPKVGEDGEPEAPGLLFLVDAREKSAALKSNLEGLKKKWVDAGKQIKTEKIRAVDFTTLMFKSDELGKTLEKIFPDPKAGFETLDEPKKKSPGKTIELLIGQSDTLLVIGSVAKDIEKVLIAQGGGGVATLSESPAFARSQASLFRDSQAYGWLHLKPIIDLVIQTVNKKAANPDGPGGGPGMFPKVDKILAALGITGLHAFAGGLKDTGDGYMMVVNVDAPAAERRGLVKAFSFEAKDANPPPFVPADAVKFTRIRLDMSKAWTTIEQAVTEAIPQMAGVLKLLLDNAGKDKDPDFDLRKQLFENLGDDLVSYEKAPKKQTIADLQNAPSLTLISSPRAEQLAGAVKAVTSLMPMGGGKVKEREFLGRKVYSMNLPSMQPGGGKGGERTLTYAASGNYVVVSTDTAMLEEYMRSSDGPSKPLRDVPGLNDAAQKVGGMGTGMFGYENQTESFRAAIEALKKDSGALADLFTASPLGSRLGMDEDGSKFKDWVDFSLLPAFDRVSKYFGIGVWSGSMTSDGFSFKYYSPTPPGLKK